MNTLSEVLVTAVVRERASRATGTPGWSRAAPRLLLVLTAWLTVGVVQPAVARQPLQMAGDREPVLRLQTRAPISQVTALSFSPDGGHLYATGWDKLVHVWSRDRGDARLRPNPAAAFRVNIGPGTSGYLNTLAISADGRWLAVAGQQVTATTSGFRQNGLIRPRSSFTQDDFREEGLIYVYSTQNRELRILRGHVGPVWGLAFSPAPGSTHLVSLAREELEPKGAMGRVRVWDVATGQQILQRPWEFKQSGEEVWPSLAVQQIGPELKDLHVAVTWGDNRLRIWNAGTGEIIDRESTASVASAFLPGSLNLVASEWPPLATQSGGVLKHWTIARDGQGKLQLFAASRQPGKIDMKPFRVPVALALFSSKPGGPVDHAAVAVVKLVSAEQALKVTGHELVIANLVTGGLINSPIALGSEGKRPCLSVSSVNRLLAVYPNENGRIAIHGLDDLLKNVAQPREVLNSDGIEVRAVAFAKNDKDDWGLLLGEERSGEPVSPRRAPVLNLSQGQMSLERAEWKPVPAPVRPGWSAAKGKPNTVEVSIPSGARRVIPLEPLGKTHRYIEFALLPPLVPNGVPLLAVASDVLGEQVLSLYHAGTGQRLRRCISHTEPVTSLAFSADGRLLVSAARDRTVCAWWLKDLSANKTNAVDERKPLFTLFQSARGAADAPSWIAWNPHGPFQSSDTQVESFVGWHFNTDRADDAPKFADIGKYRETYFGQGLLKALIETGGVPAQWPPARPAPHVSLMIRPKQEKLIEREKGKLTRWTRDETVLVRSWNAQGIVDVQGLTRNEVADIGWKLELIGPLPAAGFVPPTGSMEFAPRTGMWHADLSGVKLSPGIYRLVAAVQPTDPEIPVAPVSQVVRYQHPEPTITFEPFPLEPVNESKFHFKARIDSTEPVTTTLRLNQKAVDGLMLGPDNRIDHELMLEKGSNEIELIAVNSNALPGFEARETARTAPGLRVVYKIPGAPTVTLTAVAAEGRELKSDKLIEIDTSEIRIQATAAAPAGSKLTFSKIIVSRINVGPEKEIQLEEINFPEAAGQLKYTVDKTLTLRPGEQSIRLIAGTIGGNAEIPGLRVIHRPALPQLAVLQPDITKFIYHGEAGEFIQIQAKLTHPKDQLPFTTTILVNNQPVLVDERPLPVDSDPQTQMLSARVPLRAGVQSIQWQLANEWREPVIQPKSVRVEYRRVPRVLEVTDPKLTEQTHVTLTALIDAPPELKLEKLIVLVNEHPQSENQVVLEKSATKPGLWTATLRDLPLSQVANHIDISAQNTLGVGAAVRRTVTVVAPPQPPGIAFTNSPGENTTDASLLLEFAVQSADPVKNVELWVNRLRNPPLTPLAKNGRYSQSIPLSPGKNSIEVLATTVKGGQSRKTLVVTRVLLPIRVEINSVDWDQGTMGPVPNSGSQILFPKAVPAGIVKLRGRLVWDERARIDPLKHDVKTWVNGFLQTSTPLNIDAQPGRAGQCVFEIRTVLNRDKNWIELVFPTIPTSADNSLSFHVDSTRPKTDQKLHLMLIGLDYDTNEALERKFQEVFAISPASDLPRHADIEMCLTKDYVQESTIRGHLQLYKEMVGGSGDDDDAPNHILLVYYQGREVSKEGGFVLMDWEQQQTGSVPQLDAQLGSNTLKEYFQTTKGAHLIFLDVQSDNPSRNVQLEAHLGVLRNSERHANATRQPPLLPGALGQAVPKNNRFRAVANEVGLFFKNRVGGNIVRHDSKVPPELAELVLGRP